MKHKLAVNSLMFFWVCCVSRMAYASTFLQEVQIFDYPSLLAAAVGGQVVEHVVIFLEKIGHKIEERELAQSDMDKGSMTGKYTGNGAYKLRFGHATNLQKGKPQLICNAH